MDYIDVHRGYIELKSGTEPAKIEKLCIILEMDGLTMYKPENDPLGIKTIIAICDIFERSEAGTIRPPKEAGEKFSLEEYLTKVIENHNYDEIRRAFTKSLHMSPQEFYQHRRWEFILYWFSLGKSVEAVSVLALFQNPPSLTNYVKEKTGKCPTKLNFPAEPAIGCLKICRFHNFCANFHTCPNCGSSNFTLDFL